MKIKTFIFSMLAIMLVSCDQNGSPKTEEEITKSALECVDKFLDCMEKGNYDEAKKYCFPYTINGESYSLAEAIVRANMKPINDAILIGPSHDVIKKGDFVISPKVEIETEKKKALATWKNSNMP